jgi:hypothetical protein
MKIAIASNHAGSPLKQTILEAVQALGHEALDFGTHVAANTAGNCSATISARAIGIWRVWPKRRVNPSSQPGMMVGVS